MFHDHTELLENYCLKHRVTLEEVAELRGGGGGC